MHELTIVNSAVVERLRHARQPLSIQLDRLDGPEGVRLLSVEIHNWLKEDKTRTLKLLAKRANLGIKTVSKIWYKETTSPRFLTCILLFKALGFVAVKLER